MAQTFRDWLRIRYQEYCAEAEAWGQPRLSSEFYFGKYRWWLRREYRHSQQQAQPSAWSSIKVVFPPEEIGKIKH